MSSFVRRLAAGTFVLTAALVFSACKKKAEAESSSAEAAAEPAAAAQAPGADSLPGASEVRAALASKNYDQAVGSVMAMQGILVTADQRAQWSALFQEVREALQDAAPTNPKAAEALATLRALRSGR